ncbi:hypothetical protein NQ318_005811 [Aromia moschata]|uniref:Major facilitator superfamily (MFS) profile domain-containing protein n=1 Tax=Aromia moschata TaxID=1265417 RepID=A0AAV8YT96_9CUCU|nr:hypothetical protein NQ318_005811 [Aromia moschata]
MDEELVSNNVKKEEAEFKRSVSRQVVLGLLTNFSSIAPSMSLGFSAVAIPVLKKTLTEEEVSWFASIASLAAPFGCFFSGPIADRFGRRTAMFCVNVTCFFGWLLLAVAYHAKESQCALLLLGRVITGFSMGLSSAPATIYMAEISSSKLRGVFTTWGSISFSLGVLVVYTLGFILKDSWGTISLITATLPFVGIVIISYFVPESPTWLVGKNRLEEARDSMCSIFGTKTYTFQVQTELENIINVKIPKNYTRRKTLLEQMLRKVKYLLEPHCLKPFWLLLTYFLFQQFSGTFVIVFYAIDIVKKAGVTLDPYLTIVLIGVTRMLTAATGGDLCRCYPEPAWPFVCWCWDLTTGSISEEKIPLDMHAKLTFLPLVMLLLYFATSTLGFLPLPFAIAAEVFPTKIRGTATGLLSGCGYFFNFVTVKIYPDMAEAMGRDGVFFFYGSVAFLGTIFVIYLLPETKGEKFAGDSGILW